MYEPRDHRESKDMEYLVSNPSAHVRQPRIRQRRSTSSASNPLPHNTELVSESGSEPDPAPAEHQAGSADHQAAILNLAEQLKSAELRGIIRMWHAMRQFSHRYKDKHVRALARALEKEEISDFKAYYTDFLLNDEEWLAAAQQNEKAPSDPLGVYTQPSYVAAVDARELVRKVVYWREELPDCPSDESSENESEL